MYDSYGGYPQAFMPAPLPVPQYQQRLQALEQRFPQFAQQQPVTQQTPQIPCRYTSGIEESKAAQISFDGTPNVFIDKASDCVYIKQINLDGNADFIIYRRVTENTDNKAEPLPEPISKEEFALFATTSAQQLADIKNDIKALTEKIKK